MDMDAWGTEHLSKNRVTERTKTLKQVSLYWNIELDTLIIRIYPICQTFPNKSCLLVLQLHYKNRFQLRTYLMCMIHYLL